MGWGGRQEGVWGLGDPCTPVADSYQCMAKMWSTGEGNGTPLQYSCLENPVNSRRRQKYRTLKDELPRLVGAQYATGDQWKNNTKKNEETEPKQNNTQLWM